MLAWCQLLISSSTDFKSPSTSVLVAPSSECSRGLAGAVDQPLCAVCSSSLAVLCPSVYSAVLRGGQSVPPCVTDVSTVLIARYVNSYINEDIIMSRLHKPRLSAGRSTRREWSIGGGRHTWASRPTTDWTAGGSLLRCRRYCTELTELSDLSGYRKCVGDILDYRCLLPTWSSSRGQSV